MNREETIELMQEIEARYPTFAPSNPSKTVDVWLEEFEGFPFEVVLAGVKTFASTDTKGYPPSIGQVKDKMFSLATMNMPNVNEAWDLVQRAIADSTYHAEERFEKLPPLLQKVVGSPTTLRNWGQTDNNTLGTVIYSQFVKTYETILTREKEKAKIPRKVMALIENTSALMIEQK
jgi:hypothetical protein